MPTSAGSLSLANSFASQDSFIAKQLRNAGAVLLGKTNLTEFSNFMTENMPNGYSSRGGQTLNPYGPGKFDVAGVTLAFFNCSCINSVNWLISTSNGVPL